MGTRCMPLETIGTTTTSYTYAYNPIDRLLQVDNGRPAERKRSIDDLWGNRTSRTVGTTTPTTVARCPAVWTGAAGGGWVI